MVLYKARNSDKKSIRNISLPRSERRRPFFSSVFVSRLAKIAKIAFAWFCRVVELLVLQFFVNKN